MNSCIHNMVNQGKEIPNLPPYRGWGRDCNVGGGEIGGRNTAVL